MNWVIRYLFSALLLFLLWKLLSVLLSAAVLPSPEVAFAAFGRAVKTLDFWRHFGISAYRVACGMLIAFAIGFPAGIILGWHKLLDKYLSPFVFFTYPLPKIVFLPVFLLIFGLGDLSKILLIALIIGYQILVASRDAVLSIDKKYIDSYRSLDRSVQGLFRHVIVPAALPGAFVALRIGSGVGIAVLFFVESFATMRGLGFYIMDAWAMINYADMFAGIIGMSLLGVLAFETVNYLEKNVCAWKYLETGRKAGGAQAWTGHILRFGRMIKFSHTVFAMPFALSAVVLAHDRTPVEAVNFLWILIALVSARTAAMGFNRIVDARYDGLNPRTRERAIPAGSVTQKTAMLFVAISSLAFILAAALISWLCFWLSFPVLFILFSYSYTKRFTAWSHLFLGLAISIAPLGAWIAVTGDMAWEPLSLSIALLTYIAGFDILYACQDVAFDRKAGLCSIPARLGVKPAFHISALLHTVSFLAFCAVLIVFDLGVIYTFALFIIGALLVAEHRLVRPHDIKHIQIAFFHVNSAISVVLFLGVLLDQWIKIS